MRFIAPSLFALLLIPCAHAQSERGLRFTTGGSFLPAMRSIVVVKTGESGPGAAKHKALASTGNYKETVRLTGEGPFDLWWQPKDGIAVKILAKVKLKAGEVKDVKIDDYVGVVTVRGDGQPCGGWSPLRNRMIRVRTRRATNRCKPPRTIGSTWWCRQAFTRCGSVRTTVPDPRKSTIGSA